MGVAQTPYRLEKILQASAQLRHCPYQPLQKIPRITEARPHASGHLHHGSRIPPPITPHRIGVLGKHLPVHRRNFITKHGIVHIQPPIGLLCPHSPTPLLAHHLHRLHPPQPKSLDRPALRTRLIHPTHRLRHRLPPRLVETLHIGQGRVFSF